MTAFSVCSVFSFSISNNKRLKIREPCLWVVKTIRCGTINSAKLYLVYESYCSQMSLLFPLKHFQPSISCFQTRPIGSSPSMMQPPRHLDPSLLKQALPLKAYQENYLSQNPSEMQKDAATIGSFNNFPLSTLITRSQSYFTS